MQMLQEHMQTFQICLLKDAPKVKWMANFPVDSNPSILSPHKVNPAITCYQMYKNLTRNYLLILWVENNISSIPYEVTTNITIRSFSMDGLRRHVKKKVKCI